MNERSKTMGAFARRVRLLRAWKGLAVGACAGALGCAVWSALDWLRWAYVEPLYLVLLLLASAAAGALAGALAPVSSEQLSDSIDRRAALRDRLKTARERAVAREPGAFDEALLSDADQAVARLRPREVYPLRVGRWHGGAVVLSALAASIFLLGSTPLLLDEQERKDREELKKAGQKVERIVAPSPRASGPDLKDPDARRLAEEMKRFARELQKARLEKPEALQKANELAKRAQELTRQKMARVEQGLAGAESAFDKLQRQELKGTPFEKVDPALLNMSPAQRESAMREAGERLDELKRELEQAQREGNLAVAQQLREQIKDAERALLQLKLSQQARELLRRLFEHPLMKEIQEMARKLREEAEQAKTSGQNKLTKEQVEEMRKRLEQLQKELEELARQLKDDQALQEYLEALKKAMQDACGS